MSLALLILEGRGTEKPRDWAFQRMAALVMRGWVRWDAWMGYPWGVGGLKRNKPHRCARRSGVMGEGGGVVLGCGVCAFLTYFRFCEAERTGVHRGLHISEPKQMGEPGVTMSTGQGLAS